MVLRIAAVGNLQPSWPNQLTVCMKPESHRQQQSPISLVASASESGMTSADITDQLKTKLDLVSRLGSLWSGRVSTDVRGYLRRLARWRFMGLACASGFQAVRNSSRASRTTSDSRTPSRMARSAKRRLRSFGRRTPICGERPDLPSSDRRPPPGARRRALISSASAIAAASVYRLPSARRTTSWSRSTLLITASTALPSGRRTCAFTGSLPS